MNPKTHLLPLALLAGLASSACRQEMYDQAKIEDYEESEFYADKMGSRPLLPGTIARGELREDKLLFTGMTPEGKLTTVPPMPVDRALLERGENRFNIFCTPCHARTGTGDGMIVQRGYKRPPSFHDDRLRAEPVGYFFDVATNGFGHMPPYAVQVPVRDRWAIASYIKALQFSQNAPVALLTGDDQHQLQAPPKPKEGPAPTHHQEAE